MAVVSDEVKLIEYKKSVDAGNCLTHAIAAVLSLAGLAALVVKALAACSARVLLSAVIYGLSLCAVYTVSAVYHGLPQGEKKRRARLVDHSTVPLLIAGTATPCALVTLHSVSEPHSIFVFAMGWFCVAFGLFSKLFFFEKLKVACMTVYIVGGAAMLFCALPFIGNGSINPTAYRWLVAGNVFYIIGALFCRWGIKKEVMHVVFHILVVIGSAMHYYVIYRFVI